MSEAAAGVEDPPRRVDGGDGDDGDGGDGGDDGCEGAEDDGSSSEGEGEALALKVDPNGRVLAGYDQKRMDFKFRSFGGIFDESLLGSIREDCIRARTQARTAKSKGGKSTSVDHRDKRRRVDSTSSAASSAADSGDDSDLEDYSEGQTFWVPADTAQPATLLEAIALDIFRFHTRDCDFDPSCSGAEWWTLGVESKSADVAWHWDKDYSLEDHGINLSPHLATVTYLSSTGAPTLMVAKTCPNECAEDFAGKAHELFVSYPVPGKHSSFDGRFLHAAPLELARFRPNDPRRKKNERVNASARTSGHTVSTAKDGNTSVRCSFLVNIWLNWKPMDSIVCPESLRQHLTAYVPQASPVARLSDETELEPTEFLTNCPRIDGRGELAGRKALRHSTDTSWGFTMGERHARLDCRVDWQYMKRYVEDVGRGEGSASSIYIWQDAGFQKMVKDSSACDLAVVRTGPQPIVKLPPDIMVGGMPATMGEDGLNVQGKASVADCSNM
eukprot:g4989.t1